MDFKAGMEYICSTKRLKMETNPDELEQLKRQLAESMQRIEALEKAFASAEHRAQKYAQENEILTKQQKALQTERQELQHDYESLRLQKGGFGFKTLLANGFAGAVTGFVLCYVLFRPKDNHAEVFEHFRREQQYNVEISVNKGQLEEADAVLKECLERPEYAVIKPEIAWTRKIVAAAKNR
jgi:ATP-dependent Clp protease ATP-binding subunit ClpA